MQMHIALIGFGNVARRFVRLLDESREALDALDIEPVIVGIATRRHGGLFVDAGVERHDWPRLVDLAAAGDAVGPALSSPTAAEIIQRLGQVRSDARVMIETTVLNVQSG